MKNKQEYIICSAIKFHKFMGNGTANTSKLVLCGLRHNYIISKFYTLKGIPLPQSGGYTQGFLTSKNRFVDRKEGMKIALNADQVKYGDTHHEKELFSEDLY